MRGKFLPARPIWRRLNTMPESSILSAAHFPATTQFCWHMARCMIKRIPRRRSTSCSRELHVNYVSAAALLTLFAADLEQRRTGCIAAITSVAGDRGRRSNYVYGSAKGALSLFLQGLRSRLHPAGVKVITIKPGPVQTPMTDHLPNAARFAEPEEVARDIVRALDRRSPDVLYTPKIWRYVMAAVEHIPETLFKRLSF